MRVLTVVDDLGPGGTQRIAVHTACHYKQHNIESAVLTRKSDGPRIEQLNQAGVECFIHDPDAALAWNPDIVQAHRTGHTNKPYAELLRKLRSSGAKVIEHSHFGRCDRTKDRFLIDVHIQISRWCDWKWRQWSRGLDPKPLGVHIPHMVNASRFTRASDEAINTFRTKYNIPTDAFIYGYLAQGHHAKWSSTLFNSFRTVAESDPTSCLMIAGIQEVSKAYYADFPDDIKSRIIELPFIHGDEQLALAYSAMDTFVLATDIGETFGLVLAEAMCCNTPAVTLANPTHGNGQSEVVGHKRGGLIAANPQAVALAMQMIKDDKQLHQACAVQGREYVVSHYDPELIGSKLITLLSIVHTTNNRDELKAALDLEPALINSTSTQELHKAWGGMIGNFTLKQRLVQRLVLSPVFQTLWNSYRHRNLK